MDWLAANPERRADPRVLWPDVRSVIMLGVNYGPDENPLAILEQRARGAISVYAQGDDYHDLIKKRLKALARWLVADLRRRGQGFRRYRRRDGKAAGAGGGVWAGRASTPTLFRANSARGCFSARSSPRWICRATRTTPIIAAPARPASISARPRRFPRLTSSMRGAAFPISPSRTKARSRTNSAKPSATASMAATIASRSAHGTSSRSRGAKPNLPRARHCARHRLADLARLDDAAFRALFTKSPVKRIGRDRFIRNVLIAIGNSGDSALAVEAERLLDDDSPLVRGAAVWALSQLTERDAFAGTCRARALNAVNGTRSVRAEWHRTG